MTWHILPCVKRINNLFDADSMIKDVIPFAIYMLIHPELDTYDEDDEEQGEEEKNNSSISSLCQELEQAPFSDATYTAFGNITLSYALALAPKYYQQGVIYHEIAHNMEKAFNDRDDLSKLTRQAYGKAKQCLKGIHSYLGGEKTGKYYSEDFADFIAIKILPANTKSPDCEYLSYSTEHNEYSANSLRNLSENNPHLVLFSGLFEQL